MSMVNALKSIKHARKKYNMSEVANILDNFNYKIQIHLTKVSSKDYFLCINQIKALGKTFLFHIVSNSGICPSVLWVQGTSAFGRLCDRRHQLEDKICQVDHYGQH